MKQTEESVELIAKSFLEKNRINYIRSVPLRVRYNKNEKLRDGTIINGWTVAYEYMLFEPEVAYIEISDETAEVLYVVRKHDYLENDDNQ